MNERGFGEWISISDELPPTNKPILICARDGIVTCAKFDHRPEVNWVWWDGVGFSGYEWEWDWDDSEGLWRGVTHWMPLPEKLRRPKKLNLPGSEESRK